MAVELEVKVVLVIGVIKVLKGLLMVFRFLVMTMMMSLLRWFCPEAITVKTMIF